MSSSVSQRTEAFGTRTYFGSRRARLSTAFRLLLLRALRPEQQARSLGSLHFAYWVLLPRERIARLQRAGGADASQPAPDQMLFMSDFSGDGEVYLVGFNRVLRAALDTVWASSVGWEPKMQPGRYLRYVRRYQMQRQYYCSAYGGEASVGDTRAAVFVSEELDRFAVETEGAPPDRFAAAFKQLRIRLGNSLAA